MNDELVKGALASFCIIPELYQQAGADVSDEECQAIIENPQAGEEILKSNEDLFNQVCQIYSQAPQEIYKAAQEKVQQQQAGMFRKGGKLAYGVSKFQNGGNFARAAAYYRNHANEGIIRKLQNFLTARGYYTGGLDGKFGQKTFAAIQQYQRDNGLKDDGMWGEDTNLVHRVLGAGDTTFNGSRSGAHPGTHTYNSNFRNQPYQAPNGAKWTSEADAYRDINKIIEQAYSNPEWFWSDDETATKYREFFGRLEQGGERGGLIRQIYADTPEDIRRTIDSRKMSDGTKEAVANSRITRGTAEAVPYVVSALSLPMVVEGATHPINALTGLAGAGIGRVIGGAVENMRAGEQGHYTDYDEIGNRQIPVVTPERTREQEGAKAVGTVLGAGLGYKAADGLMSPSGAATDWARGGYRVARSNASITPRLASSNGTSTITGFKVQTPGTVNWATQGIVTPRAFPVGFKEGGRLVRKNQLGGKAQVFDTLPTNIYNENGVLLGNANDPSIWNYINSRKEPRTWAIKYPTLQAQLNNTANKISAASNYWNPGNLPTDMTQTTYHTRFEDGTSSNWSDKELKLMEKNKR